MIAVDTSAVVAILEKEDDAGRYIAALEADDAPLMSAASFVELNAVMRHKRGAGVVAIVERFVEAAAIGIEPLTPAQARLAVEGYLRFASLNFGDAFAYALAREKGIPLLFKGEDFAKTDVLMCQA